MEPLGEMIARQLSNAPALVTNDRYIGVSTCQPLEVGREKVSRKRRYVP